MDSITQFALGASVGEAVLGRKVGNKAIWWGGIAGTLPDLDTFIPYANAVQNFTYHRGFTHSFLFLSLITPLLVWLILKLHPQTKEYWRGWSLLIFLSLVTHALLDAFTAYGTQLFWPLDVMPVAWSTIFIIDPLFTLPLLFGILTAMFMFRNRSTGHLISKISLSIAVLYLSISVVMKLSINKVTEDLLEQQGIAYQQYITLPTPFNIIAWRVLVMADEGGYYQGYYSFLSDADDIKFEFYPSQPELLDDIKDEWVVQRLQWFTKGFYAVRQKEHEIYIIDLRMGTEPKYAFTFKIAEESTHGVRLVPAEHIRPPPNTDEDFQRLWRFIKNGS